MLTGEITSIRSASKRWYWVYWKGLFRRLKRRIGSGSSKLGLYWKRKVRGVYPLAVVTINR